MKEPVPQRRPKGPLRSPRCHREVTIAQMRGGAQKSRHCSPSRPRMAQNLFYLRCMLADMLPSRRRRQGQRQRSLPCPKPLLAVACVRTPPLSAYRTSYDAPPAIVFRSLHTLSFFYTHFVLRFGSSFTFPLALSLFTCSLLTLTHSLSFLLTPLTVLVVILLGSLPYQG